MDTDAALLICFAVGIFKHQHDCLMPVPLYIYILEHSSKMYDSVLLSVATTLITLEHTSSVIMAGKLLRDTVRRKLRLWEKMVVIRCSQFYVWICDPENNYYQRLTPLIMEANIWELTMFISLARDHQIIRLMTWEKNQNIVTWWIVLYGTENQRNVTDNLGVSLETNKLGENQNEKFKSFDKVA